MQISKVEHREYCGGKSYLRRRNLIGIVAFLSLFASSQAYGQATYSDTWADDSGVPPNTIYDEDAARTGPYADGCGVTDGAYTHSYYVDVTLTSPNGRTDYRSSPRRIGYARSDISLLWNSDDNGEYITDTQHWARCPYDELYYYSLGFKQIRFLFGASINVMFHQAGTSNPSVYYAIPNCNVICPVTGYIRPDYAGSYVWLIVPRGPIGCLRGSIVKRFAPYSQCFDVSPPGP